MKSWGYHLGAAFAIDAGGAELFNQVVFVTMATVVMLEILATLAALAMRANSSCIH